jgi:flagellar biosynthetic protein FliR
MTATFDAFAPETVAVTALLAARIGGMLLVAPVLSGRPVPQMLRAAILILLTAVLLPPSVTNADPGALVTAATLVAETVVGFAIGLGAAVIVGGAEIAGDLLSIHMGLSGASTLDPMTQQSVPLLGEFTRFFAIALLLAANGHLLMIEALAGTLHIVPIGGGLALAEGARTMVALGGSLFELGLRFAAPVTAAVLVANVALGVLARTVPQMNVLMVAFPVQIGIGLLTLAVALPLIAVVFSTWPSDYEALLGRLLGSLMGSR